MRTSLDRTQPATRRTKTGIAIPISLSRTRFKLFILVLLAVVSSLSDSPEWLTLILILTGAAIPLALAVLGGAELVRALFLLPVPPKTIRKDDLI